LPPLPPSQTPRKRSETAPSRSPGGPLQTVALDHLVGDLLGEIGLAGVVLDDQLDSMVIMPIFTSASTAPASAIPAAIRAPSRSALMFRPSVVAFRVSRLRIDRDLVDIASFDGRPQATISRLPA
jgi:hypothetical protein